MNLATAALLDLIGRKEQLQAAVIRGAPPEEVEMMRQQMHDLFDAFIDLSIEAAQHVRAIAHPR